MRDGSPMARGRVLVVGADTAVVARLQAALAPEGYQVAAAASAAAACAAGAELVLLDRGTAERLLASGGPSPSLNLEERERTAIRQALEVTGWNKQAAARLLGLHRPTLYSKMRKHGIPQRSPRPDGASPGGGPGSSA